MILKGSYVAQGGAARSEKLPQKVAMHSAVPISSASQTPSPRTKRQRIQLWRVETMNRGRPT